MKSSTVDRADWKKQLQDLPAVRRDFRFWSMTATQFLGAFNDNLYKQLVLLFCTHLYLHSGGQGSGDGYQAAAFAVFTLPFVLLSGFAGYLSDLYEKKTVVVLCKVAEIVVMVGGTFSFFLAAQTGHVWPMFVVLFFMGAQSAFFGPSKYGILPEAFRSNDLPYVNGVFIMTTFLAIILGTVLAGELMGASDPVMVNGVVVREGVPLWLTSLACVLTAVIGTTTSFFVRRTPAANPHLRFRLSNLAIDGTTWRVIRNDRIIFNVLIITSIFWMIGGVIQQAVNGFAKYQLALSDPRTGRMLAGVAIGIAIGCVIAGRFSKGQIKFWIYKVGNAGIILSLLALGLIGLWGPNHQTREVPPADTNSKNLVAVSATESTQPAMTQTEVAGEVDTIPEEPVSAFEWTCRILLFLTGISAGMFTVPLQTFLQVRPPDEEKGRVIAAMNLFNWIGILFGAAVYFGVSFLIDVLDWPQSVHFLCCAGVMALLFIYRIDERNSHRPYLG